MSGPHSSGSIDALASVPPWEKDAHGEPAKKKGPEESSAKEERSSAAAMVGELKSLKAHHPYKAVSSGQWKNLGFWMGRATLSGAVVSFLLFGAFTSELLSVLALGVFVPVWAYFSMAAHLDQFLGDRPLAMRSQIAHWSPLSLQMLPSFLTYSLFGAAMILVGALGSAVALPLGLIFFGYISMAWLCTISEIVLLGKNGTEALHQGLSKSAWFLFTWPFYLFRGIFTFRWNRRTSGGEFLVSTLFSVLAQFGVFMGVGIFLISLYISGFSGESWSLLSASFALLLFPVACMLSLDTQMGVWTHHYLAAEAERQNGGEIRAIE